MLNRRKVTRAVQVSDPHFQRLKLSDDQRSMKATIVRNSHTGRDRMASPLDWFTRFSISCYFGGYYQSGAADGDIEADVRSWICVFKTSL